MSDGCTYTQTTDHLNISFPAKWHFIASNGIGRVHECVRWTDGQTDHAKVTSAAMGKVTVALLLNSGNLLSEKSISTARLTG